MIRPLAMFFLFSLVIIFTYEYYKFSNSKNKLDTNVINVPIEPGFNRFHEDTSFMTDNESYPQEKDNNAGLSRLINTQKGYMVPIRSVI